MKKLFILSLFLIIAVASVGMAFAASEDIGGHTFNIPYGFNGLNSNKTQDNMATTFNKVFENSNGDIINITVLVCNPGIEFTSVTPNQGVENKTINGIEGLLSNNTDTNRTIFSFVENNTQRLISIEASNANDIEACLK